MAGRPRNPNVLRDKNGKSTGHYGIHPETLAVRERKLRELGLPLTYVKQELTNQGWADVEKPMAENRLCGFTLGVLYLRHRANPGEPGGISEAQYNAGEAWSRVVHRHAAIMGYSLRIASPAFVMVGGGSGGSSAEDEEEIKRVRERYAAAYNKLAEAARIHGRRVWEVCYAVCVDSVPVHTLTKADFGHLRTGLNALAKVF